VVGGPEAVGFSVFGVGALAYLVRHRFTDLPERHEEWSIDWSWQLKRADRLKSMDSVPVWEEALSVAGLNIEKGLMFRKTIAIVCFGIVAIAVVVSVTMNA
jgi:hypothetical protein